MRDERRTMLMQRQLQIARIARRDATAELSDLAEEEARTVSLARRSRTIAGACDTGARVIAGDELRGRAAFAASLEQVAREAERAGRDAIVRADAKAAALATAKNREQRLDQLVRERHRALEIARDQRALFDEQSMARELA